MILTPVTGSSVIAAHAYDPDTRKLWVKTHSGDLYEYDEVPAEKAHAFAGNASMGAYWNKKIQPYHKGRKVSG